MFCSGKILHIDFGDCFEASMNREKFPEKVGISSGMFLLYMELKASLNYKSKSKHFAGTISPH